MQKIILCVEVILFLLMVKVIGVHSIDDYSGYIFAQKTDTIRKSTYMF